MALQVNLSNPAATMYSVSVAVTDKRLWGKPLQVIDQIEIVRGNNIVGVVTNVAPVLAISHFNNDDSRPQDKLTVPTRPLHCGEGTRSFGPPLTPGRYQLYVEAIAVR